MKNIFSLAATLFVASFLFSCHPPELCPAYRGASLNGHKTQNVAFIKKTSEKKSAEKPA